MPTSKDPIIESNRRIKISKALFGKPKSEDHKKKLKESAKRTHTTEEFKMGRGILSKKQWGDPAFRKKTTIASKIAHTTIEFRERQSKLLREIKGTEEARKTNSEAQKKEYMANPDHRIKIGNKSRERGQDQEYCNKQRILKYDLWYGGVKYYDGRPQYCEKFNSNFKGRARAFWGYTCFECGELEVSKKHAVHHIHYDKKMCCNGSPKDVVVLCHSCHAATNSNRDYWERHFTELLYAYHPDGKCYFTKEEMKSYNSFKY